MASHKGRHRRPSRTSAILPVVAGGSTLAAGTVLAVTATGAQAQVTHLPAPAAAVRSAPARETAAVVAVVAPGNSLSQISQADCGTAADWTGIYDANVKVIGGNPDLIEPGQHLVISCRTGWAPQPPAVQESSVQYHASGVPAARSVPVRDVSTAGDGSFQSCVISRESGGNPDIWNASGHWGLYQFSESTWIAYGGSAGSFGNASVAEQNQVFGNAMATPAGAGNWAPYDGC